MGLSFSSPHKLVSTTTPDKKMFEITCRSLSTSQITSLNVETFKHTHLFLKYHFHKKRVEAIIHHTGKASYSQFRVCKGTSKIDRQKVYFRGFINESLNNVTLIEDKEPLVHLLVRFLIFLIIRG
jgi:hypothetical protein